jgi:hypothetical protein
MTGLLNYKAFNESKGNAYRDEVDNHGKMKNLTIYNSDPKGKYSNAEDIKGTVEFNMDFTYKRSGIEDIMISYMDFALTIENLGDDDKVEEHEVEFTVNNPDFETGTFPLYLSDIEIDMKKSDDPSKWVVTFKLGHFKK